MSKTSRAREYNRRFRHAFPSWETFRAWQANELAKWLAERVGLCDRPCLLADREYVAVVYPEPDLVTHGEWLV